MDMRFATSSIFDSVGRLQVIDASNCSFTGAVPDTAFQGSWLRRINLSFNKLTGSISNTLTSFAMQVSICNTQIRNIMVFNCCTPVCCTCTHMQLQAALLSTSKSTSAHAVLGNSEHDMPRAACTVHNVIPLLSVLLCSSGTYQLSLDNGYTLDLQGMQLANNSLTGTVPAAIANFTLLDTLDLAYNSLQ